MVTVFKAPKTENQTPQSCREAYHWYQANMLYDLPDVYPFKRLRLSWRVTQAVLTTLTVHVYFQSMI